ncbi:hypothetical protein EBZ39_10345 [bacterium]|jgi:hypothetical protein|nr:hypothetical protein [bacterium]
MAKLAIDVVLNKAAAMTGLRGLEKDVSSFGKSMLGIVGIGGGLAGLVAGIDNILAKAGQLQDVSDAFNVSAESVQRLAAVGVTANLSIEEIGSKLGKLGKAAQDAAGGNTNLAKTFEKIGVTGQQLVSLSPEQLFDKLRESVSSGALAGEELKVVNELLAKDYQRFLPLLRMTAEEYKNLGSASGVLSDTTVSNLDAMNVRWRQFQNTVSTALASIAGGFLDLGTDIKESPLQSSLDFLTGDYDKIEKRIIERERKLKEVIQKERTQRAGDQKTVTDQAELDREDVNAVRQKVKQIDAELAAIDKAYQMLADSEEDRRKQDLADFKQAEKEKRDLLQKRAELIPALQELEARRAGPEAEMRLLEDRAREAADKARTSGTIEDVTAAQQQALELQSAKENALSQRGFGDQSAQLARAQTESIVGKLQSAAELQQQLRDIPSSTEAQRTQPVRLENPPSLQGVLDKLDLLIKNAGVFS